jgi:amino acid transporter
MSVTSSPSAGPPLDRRLGFWGLWALGVGAVVGDGIFVLLGQGIQTAGPSAFLAFLVAGLFQLFLMVALGELAVGMPSAGAMSVWVGRLVGDGWGFLAGFAFALGWVFAGGSVGLAIGKVTCWFFLPGPTPFWVAAFAVVFLTLFAGCNLLGAELAVRTQLVLVLLLVGLMAAFAVFGVGSARAENFIPLLPHGWRGFWLAVPLGTYAYLGAVTLTTAGGECKSPRDLPRALVWSSVTFLLLYTAAQAVLEGIVPWHEVTADVPPFTLAADRVFGKAGAWVMNLAAWLAAATTLLMGTIYAPSRIFYSQARAGYLPAALGRVHPRTRTPVVGIAAVWAASVALVLWGVRDVDYYYEAYSLQLVFAWMVSWVLAVAAAVLYRRRCPDEVRALPWRQPLFPLFPVLGLLGIAVVTVFTFEAVPLTLGVGAGWIVALAVYYRAVVARRVRPAGGSEPAPVPQAPESG